MTDEGEERFGPDRVRPPTVEERQANEAAMAETMMKAMAADVGDRQWRDANNYQRQCLTTAALDVTETWYFALGLGNEVGELQGKIKKLYRDDGGVMSDERRELIKGELGDAAWYLAALAASCGLELGDVFAGNVNKLKGRVERGTLKGDGDVR